MKRTDFLLTLALVLSAMALGAVLMYAYDHPDAHGVTITITVR